MRSVAHFGTGVGRAFHDFPSQFQQEIGQRNGCFYLVEIDFHTIGGWLDGFYNIFWKKVSDCFLMLWFLL